MDRLGLFVSFVGQACGLTRVRTVVRSHFRWPDFDHGRFAITTCCLSAMLFAGCQSQRPTDPFLGRSTIPPPSTNFAPNGGNQPYYTPPTNSRPPSMQNNFGQPAAMTPPSLPPTGAGYGNPAPNYNNPPNYNPNFGAAGANVPNYNQPNYNPPNIPPAYPTGSPYPNAYPNNAPSNYPNNISPTYPPSIPPTSSSGYGGASGFGTAPNYGNSQPLNNSFTTPPNGGMPSWSPNATPSGSGAVPYNGSGSFGAPNPQYMPPSGASNYPNNRNPFSWQQQPQQQPQQPPNPSANSYANANTNPYGNPYANPYYYPNGMATGYSNPNPANYANAGYPNGSPSGAYPNGQYAPATNPNAYPPNLQQNSAVPDNALVRVISPRSGSGYSSGGYTGGSNLPGGQSLPVANPVPNNSAYPNSSFGTNSPPVTIPSIALPSNSIPGGNDLREPRRLENNLLPPVEMTDLPAVNPGTAARYSNRPTSYNDSASPSVDMPLVAPDANR